MSSNPEMQDMILRNFFTNEAFMRQVVPFMDPSYLDGVHRSLFLEFASYVARYNGIPSLESFRISLSESEKMTETQYTQAQELLPTLFTPDRDTELQWLLDNTEKFCQDKALFNAVMESISIIDGKHKSLGKGALPDILSKALGVSFDTNIGHSYLDDAESRFEFYHKVEERVPFDLDYLNKITKGGLPNKSLNIVLAGTGVGKSLFMCHCAAGALSMGKNVLYITMEMSEERIAERIDANLLDVSLDKIETLTKEAFVSKVSSVSAKTQGKLIIKEYPTGQAHSGHFRALLNELKLKKKFIPDVIYIDYLNICSSSRIKGLGGSVNTYSFIKSIAEELRGLAVEFDVPIVSATQTTRSGFANSDPGLEDTSESFGLPATADLMLAMVSNEELEKLGQVMVKQLKNRYSDPNSHKRFVLGIDRSKMRLFDVEEAELGLVDDGQDTPVFDATPSGKKLSTQGFQM